MTLAEQIAALPEWPKEDNYSAQFRLASGVAVTYSYPADDFRLAQATVDAALARLALAREWIEGIPHVWDCDLCHGAKKNPRCTCGRDALLNALEVPR